MHCSVMGSRGAPSRRQLPGRGMKDDHEEGALVCKCFAIDAVLIEDTVRANGLVTVEEVTNYTRAGGGCSSRHESRKSRKGGGRMGGPKALHHLAAAPAPVAEAPKPAAKAQLTSYQRMRKIEEVVERSARTLVKDGGDIEIVEVAGKDIYVNLKGACAGCMMEQATLGGIQQN